MLGQAILYLIVLEQNLAALAVDFFDLGKELLTCLLGLVLNRVKLCLHFCDLGAKQCFFLLQVQIIVLKVTQLKLEWQMLISLTF